MVTTNENARVKCPACGTQNTLAHAYCESCGRTLGSSTPVPGVAVSPPMPGRVECPTCSKLTPAGFPFCQYCGKRVEEPAQAQQEVLVSAPSALPEAPSEPEPQSWGTLSEIEPSGQIGARHPLASDVVLLGRGGDIAVAEEHLAHRHLRLERAADGCRIVPLDPHNGVFLRISQPTVLYTGDHLLLGSELLLFERVEDAERDAAPLKRQGLLLLGSPARRSWGRLTELTENGSAGDVRHLTAPEFVLGRENGDWLFPDDDCMSRRHASLSFDENDVKLADLGSANGSYVRVREPRVVPSGTMLRLGTRLFIVEV